MDLGVVGITAVSVFMIARRRTTFHIVRGQRRCIKVFKVTTEDAANGMVVLIRLTSISIEEMDLNGRSVH